VKIQLLPLLLLVAGLIAWIRPKGTESPPVQQPNILWISCEDMSPRLGCYGDTTIPTPNIDRLAREGIRYTNAFCTAGVCAPSRNAIITGMYQTSTGGHNMRTLYNTFPQQTGLPEAYSVVMPPEVKAFPEYLRARGYFTSNNAKTDYQFEEPPTVWDEVGNKAHWRNRKDQQPFFAVFNNVVTHESQVWARKDQPLRVDPSRISLPPYYPDTKTVRQDMARFYSNIRELDDWVGGLLKQLEEDGLLDKTIIFFWSDHGDGLPFVKREVYDRGIRVPLVVRFPDGRFAGTTRPELVSMIDLAPTVLRLAGMERPRHLQGRAILDGCGRRPVDSPLRTHVFAARDRMDTHYDRVRSVHDGRYQYVRNFYPEKPLYMDLDYRRQQPMMVDILRLRDEGKLNATQMLWFRPTKSAEELYDLRQDPHQLTNLADRPAYAAHLKRLRGEMDRWLTETGDLGGTEEKELIRRMWQGGDQPPVTEAPTFTRQGDKLHLACATPGASIGYKFVGEGSGWRVYSEPVTVPADRGITAVAMRIGYRRSPEVSIASLAEVRTR